MTIIACSAVERAMLADTQVTDGRDFRDYYVVKIVRAADGSLVGASGSAADTPRITVWLRKGAKGAPPADAFKDADGVRLTPDGKIWYYFGPVPQLVVGPVFAIGSGGRLFTAAYRAGAGLRRAVEIACELSGSCGGEITELRLEPAPAKAGGTAPKRRRRRS